LAQNTQKTIYHYYLTFGDAECCIMHLKYSARSSEPVICSITIDCKSTVMQQTRLMSYLY